MSRTVINSTQKFPECLGVLIFLCSLGEFINLCNHNLYYATNYILYLTFKLFIIPSPNYSEKKILQLNSLFVINRVKKLLNEIGVWRRSLAVAILLCLYLYLDSLDRCMRIGFYTIYMKSELPSNPIQLSLKLWMG